MSFAGVSLIHDSKLWPSSSATNDVCAASGYHLLVVEGYSRTKADVPYGDHIKSTSFRVGGYLWFLKYFPNGSSGDFEDYLSPGLVLAQDVAKPVKAQFSFCFIDQAAKQEPSHIRSTKVCDFPSKYHTLCHSNFIKRDELENSSHLTDDGFTIRCDIVVIEDVVTSTTSPLVTVPPLNMQRHFTDLLKDKEGNNVTFQVGDETITAHRCVLVARSRVFKAELFGPMKEGTATDCTIHVEDMVPRVFRAMLEFIYSDSEPEMEDKDGEDAMRQWQHLLVAADRYDLQQLKLMCEDKLCRFISASTTTTILGLAEQRRCDGLKKACYDFLGVPGESDSCRSH